MLWRDALREAWEALLGIIIFGIGLFADFWFIYGVNWVAEQLAKLEIGGAAGNPSLLVTALLLFCLVVGFCAALVGLWLLFGVFGCLSRFVSLTVALTFYVLGRISYWVLERLVHG